MSSLSGLYRCIVNKVTDEEISIEVPELGLENLKVQYVFSLGFKESRSGLHDCLPQEEDEAMVAFENGEHHRPILLLGRRFEV